MDYRRHFSYVKDIYIELKDYTFFHSPSQGGGSERFVGRRNLKERLSEILSKAETPAGAYIVTGYRGVGKSSVVNEVLDELSMKSLSTAWRKLFRPIIYTLLIALFLTSSMMDKFLRPYDDNPLAWKVPYTVIHFSFLFLFFVLGKLLVQALASRWKVNRVKVYVFIVSLVTVLEVVWKDIEHTTFYYGSMALYVFVWIWLAETSSNKNDLQLKHTSNLGRFMINALNAFRMDTQRFPKETHYHVFQAIFFVASPVVFYGPLFLSKEFLANHTTGELILVLLLMLGLFFLSILLMRIMLFGAVLRNWKYFELKIKPEVWLRNLMNYSRRLNIRINLAHEELSEAEVLRLIAKKIYSEYSVVRNILWGAPFNLVNITLKVILIFYILSLVVSVKAHETATEQFKKDIHFTYLFPSQDFTPVKSPVVSISAWERGYYFVTTTRYIDQMFRVAYERLATALSINRDNFNIDTTSTIGCIISKFLPREISLFPKGTPNYLLIIEFIILWIGVHLLFRTRPFNIITHSSVLKRFKDLNDRIDASLEMEGSHSVGTAWKWFTATSRRKKSFPIAGAREIEAELTSILNDINKIPRFLNRPEFVIILDDLGKLRRHDNRTIQDKESEDPSTSEDVVDESARIQRESIVRLIANLKDFMSEAKAKFIFIAGREMYDASLADISDRDNFVVSIFPDNPYVKSLLTDEPGHTPTDAHSQDHRSYHTSLIEEYVCQFLIPRFWSRKHKSRSLKTYKEYLYEFHSTTEINLLYEQIGLPEESNRQLDTRILNASAMVCLNRLIRSIIYSKYRYNPWFAFNRLLLMIESGLLQSLIADQCRWFIDAHQEMLLNNGKIRIFLGETVRAEKVRSENADYILFHLRNFITYLTYRCGGAPKKLSFLLEQHVVPIDRISDTSNNRRSDEIKQNPLSVIIGHSSNNLYLHFTHHDIYTFGVMNYLTTPFMHSIGRHLNEDKMAVSSTYLLDHLYKFHNSGFSWRNLEVTPEIVDINKAPSLRQLIDDIVHFLCNTHLENVVSGMYDFRFDQRLSQEITILSKANPRESAAFNFTLDESQKVKRYYHSKLKILRESYSQKQSAEDGAFLHSVGFIHASIGDLHYYDQEYDDALVQYKDAVQNLRESQEQDRKEGELDASRFLVYVRVMLRIGLTYEKKKAFASALLTYDDLSMQVIEFLPRLLPSFRTLSEKLLVNDTQLTAYRDHLKVSIASSVRLLYQPFLAKLYLKEKEKIGGIKTEDLNLAGWEINYITERITGTDQGLITSEFYNKMGDILFFKNRDDVTYESLDAQGMYLSALRSIISILCPSGLRPVVSDVPSAIAGTISILWQIRKNNPTVSAMPLRMLANDLTDLADVVLTDAIPQMHVPRILQILQKTSVLELPVPEDGTDSELDESIVLFMLAAEVYRFTHDFKKSAHQYIKILYLLEQNIGHDTISPDDIAIIENAVVIPALRNLYLAFNPSSRLEIEKIKSIFKDDHISSPWLQYLPAYAEIQEVIALFLMLRNRTMQFIPGITDPYFSEMTQFSNHSIPSMYSRIAVMNMKIRYNRRQFSALPVLLTEDNLHLKEFLIADSIFCATTIIRILTSMGSSFITSHSLYGFAFERRGDWCAEYQKLRNYGNNSFNRCSKSIKDLLGSATLDNLQPNHNYEKALLHFMQARGAHTGKTAFMNMIDKMHYLDDDFDDEYYHFHAALERNRLERIDQKIEELQLRLSQVEEVFNFETYLH